jgi:surface carbohydrate biosynthesis protein
MGDSPSTLIIPVETQVRELEAKILLACVAAERGFPVILGSRAFVHFKVASMPRGVYLAKSMRSLSIPMFKILRQLGDEIVAWEEEALVHPPAETYFTKRLSPVTMKCVSHLFAWGEEDAELYGRYPELPAGIPIHITGNPRGDLLRPDVRGYFGDEAQHWRKTYGDFILINTSFPDVSPFIPSVGLFLPTKNPRKKARYGQAGLGLGRQFAEALRDHKQAVLEDFKRLVPPLEEAFPDFTIVIRPHPSENCAIYHDLAARCQRVRVTNEGNIIPWLLAAKAMIHNGCTTGVEAYALGVPAVAYLATLNEEFDYGFQRLPNELSHQCFSFDELKETLGRIFSNTVRTTDDYERRALLARHLTAQEGSLACERMVDVLEEAGYRKGPPPATRIGSYAKGWLHNKIRAAATQIYMRRPGPNRLAYHDHRFPAISVAEMEEKIGRFGKLLNRFEKIRVSEYSKHIFRITG